MAAVVIQRTRRHSSANLLLYQQRADLLQGQPSAFLFGYCIFEFHFYFFIFQVDAGLDGKIWMV
jgi:hypothetical protein